MSSDSCPHLVALKAAKGLEPFRILYNYFVHCSTPKDRKRKVVLKVDLSHNLSQAETCMCYMCKDHRPRLHGCVQCVYFGCYDFRHIQDHSTAKKHHICKSVMSLLASLIEIILALELSYGTLYCNSCHDFVYDDEVDGLTKECKRRALASLGNLLIIN